MEFKQAMRIFNRICKEREMCEGGALSNKCIVLAECDYAEVEAILAKWAEEHPEKTIADDFLEKHPKAPKTDAGTPYACAVDLGYSMPSSCHREMDCCSECWRRPLEEAE
jgi:hypothetical protein